MRDSTSSETSQPESRETAVTPFAGRYEIERLVGGGMAEVYRAWDLEREQHIALKIYSGEQASGMGAARFLREIETMSLLDHPDAVPVYDSGAVDGNLYYVMPWIEGGSLRQRLDAEAQLPLTDVFPILRDVVGTLAVAHERGIVHRDIKPDNVMLENGRALLTDFGIAKLLRRSARRLSLVGVPIGTPSYMAPEQVLGEESIDHRADIYAVGVLAYELLTGLPTFTCATPHQTMVAHLQDRPTDIRKLRPDLCPRLGRMIMRCLEKKPAKRWQSTGELLLEIDAGCGRQTRRAFWSRGVQSIVRHAAAIAAGVASASPLFSGVLES